MRKTKEKKWSSQDAGRASREKLDDGARAVDAEAQKCEKELVDWAEENWREATSHVPWRGREKKDLSPLRGTQETRPLANANISTLWKGRSNKRTGSNKRQQLQQQLLSEGEERQDGLVCGERKKNKK